MRGPGGRSAAASFHVEVALSDALSQVELFHARLGAQVAATRRSCAFAQGASAAEAGPWRPMPMPSQGTGPWPCVGWTDTPCGPTPLP